MRYLGKNPEHQGLLPAGDFRSLPFTFYTFGQIIIALEIDEDQHNTYVKTYVLVDGILIFKLESMKQYVRYTYIHNTKYL